MPPDGLVHLWFLDLKKLGSPLILSQEGDAEAALLPRQERTIRRFYLRLLLGAYLGLSGKDVRISRMVKGKPVLEPMIHQHQLEFSLAGSKGCCLIGISTSGQLGVDLEMEGRKTSSPHSLARRYFSKEEQQGFSQLSGEDLDRAFLYTWACKEAVVKAAGHGIANQLCRFTVNTDPNAAPGVQRMLDDDVDAWRLAMVQPSVQHLGAVALRHERLEMQGFRLVHRS